MNQPSTEPAKKPYAPPALIEHGTVRDLTQAEQSAAGGSSPDL